MSILLHLCDYIYIFYQFFFVALAQGVAQSLGLVGLTLGRPWMGVTFLVVL